MDRFLSCGDRLKLKGIDGEYVIRKIIGRGSSCVVYLTDFSNKTGQVTEHLLKEFNPKNIEFSRDRKGVINFKEEGARRKYEEQLERFKKGYDSQIIFHRKKELKNYTSNIQNIYEDYGTVYIDMNVTEGESYEGFKEKSLFNLARRIKVLSQVIKMYHDAGYLYLDLKPANIYVRPEHETCEDLLLVDFDSVVNKKELQFLNEVSYTPEWAPLELVSVQRKKEISNATDIFSIGEIFFVKLMGRHSTPWERNSFSEYEYDFKSGLLENVNPKVKPLLDELFRHTLCNAVTSRYQSVDKLIDILNQIIPIVDQTQMYVRSNFIDNERCFVGRDKELSLLEDKLKLSEVHVVFLSGIGGIGKTEIAKRYAHIHEKDYDTIVFLRFQNTLEETFALDDLEIYNFESCDTEPVSDYFKKKLKILDKLLTEKDLLIIDNFDVEEDNNLEDILNECKCKFIITTRFDFRDYNYEQIEVEGMRDSEEALNLFSAYNNEYPTSEKDNILNILEIADFHTMMITLLAKYLRDSEETPSMLYQEFLEKERIINLDDTIVKHRKDKKLSSESVVEHLRILFNYSDFSLDERRILMELSLFGAVRIQSKLLFEIFDGQLCERIIKKLIRRGWVEFDDDKISLHQIILDLIYNDLKPDTENCPGFANKMVLYFRRTEENHVMKLAKKKLANNLIERMSGNDYRLAEVYYEYCYNINWDANLLDKAEQFCIEDDAVEAYRILTNIKILCLRKTLFPYSVWDLENGIQKEMVDYFYQKIFQKELDIFSCFRQYVVRKENLQKIKNIAQLQKGREKVTATSDNVFGVLKEGYAEAKRLLQEVYYRYIDDEYPIAENLSDSTATILYDMATSLISLTNSVCNENMVGEEAETLGFYGFYRDCENILLYLYQVMERYPKHFSLEFKKKLIMELAEFYKTDGYLDLSRIICVGNPATSAYYSQKMDELPINNNMLSVTSYFEAAEEARSQGNFSEAIDLYKLAEQNEEVAFDEIKYKMSEVLIELQCYSEAEKILFDVLKYDKQKGLNPCYTYQKLEELYEVLNKKAEAIECCEQICDYLGTVSPCDDSNNVGWRLECQVKKLKLEGRNLLALCNEEFMLFEKNLMVLLNSKRLDGRFVEVFLEYHKIAKIMGNHKEIIERIFSAAKKYSRQGNEIESIDLYMELINDKFVERECRYIYIRALIAIANIHINSLDNYGAGLIFLKKVEMYLKNTDSDYNYINEKIKRLKIDIEVRSYQEYGLNLDFLKKSCDFYLVTKQDILENEIYDEFEAWNDTAQQYIEIGNTDMGIKCKDIMKDYLDSNFSSCKFMKLCDVAFSICRESENKCSYNQFKLLFDYFLQVSAEKKLKIGEQISFLEKFADNALHFQMDEYAFRIYLFACVALLHEQWYRSAISKKEISLQVKIDDIQKIDFIFPGEVDKQKIDECVRILDLLLKGFQDNNHYSGICKKICEIKKCYEEAQIEFRY